MTNNERKPVPFDEQAALAELEAVARELEASRQRRRVASEAFDGFLNSFKGSTPEPGSPSRQVRGGAARTPLGELPRGGTSLTSDPAPRAAEASATPHRGALRKAARFGVPAIVLGLVVVFFGTRGTAPEPQESTRSAASMDPGDAAQPAIPLPSEPAATTGTPRTELTTLRPVWVRVVVDGERLLERELPAGETVPLSPRETIVLRAGDAGAVRLAIGGKDQGPLGPDGRAVTRTFDVTALR